MSSIENHWTGALVDFAAGAIGGTVCSYTGQPMDTIKVKMQTYPHLYSNAMRCAFQTIKREGFLRLYAGAVPAAAANVAQSSFLFLSYGQCSKAVAFVAGNSKDDMTLLQKAVSGSLAAFFAAFALCPMELIKCRMQTLDEFRGTHQNITPQTIVRDVLRSDGILGFYRGIQSTVLREVPGYFVFFGGYEGTRYLLANPGQKVDDIGVLKTLLAGGIGGGCLSWAAIYPIDVIKSRTQVYSAAGGKTLGVYEVCKILYAEGGVRTFYAGIGPTLLRAFPACAALFVGYEYSKVVLETLVHRSIELTPETAD